MRIGSQSTNPQTPYLSKKTRKPPELGGCPLAEKEGFEPSRQLPQPTPLAGEPLTATWVLLRAIYNLAEREGFEPPVPCDITGFQDQLHKPLGHLSMSECYCIIANSGGAVKQCGRRKVMLIER